MALRPLVILDDGILTSMLADQRFISAIPCVQKAATEIKNIAGCSSCSRKRTNQTRQAMATLRTCLISTSTAVRTQLKQLLNAQKVRVRVIRGNRATDFTF